MFGGGPQDTGTAPGGVLILRIDPFEIASPQVKSWLTPGHTDGPLLVRREDDHGLYLNELRHLS
ncbi:MAG: hypothetical protein ABSF61_14075 [Anaerolineales bacterium]